MTARASKTTKKPTSKEAEDSRTKLSQADVPAFSLAEAIRVPKAIGDHYGYKPTKPLNVAAGMSMQPNSSTFRMLAGAAIAYGLTLGGPNAPEISITPLGLRIVRQTVEGDDLAAKREALMKPRVIGEFLRRYADAPVPRDDIAHNVLLEMGVPRDRAPVVLKAILSGAESVGFLRDIKGKKYVTLEGITPSSPVDRDSGELDDLGADVDPLSSPLPEIKPAEVVVTDAVRGLAAKRVYITHGKNRSFVEPVKKLLSFGELEPIVSVERTSVSIPVPDKIMGEMRSCGAAIIHVDAEMRLMDSEAKEHGVLNPNVLMEIGAAMALFGRRFILLVREGVKLPSNLQGLFEVRYSGETLDGDATVRLLEAIRDIKNHPLPDRYGSTS